jgi:hypothetical protein
LLFFYYAARFFSRKTRKRKGDFVILRWGRKAGLAGTIEAGPAELMTNSD